MVDGSVVILNTTFLLTSLLELERERERQIVVTEILSERRCIGTADSLKKYTLKINTFSTNEVTD